MKRYHFKAYTLLEIMIVLTIIGILMAIGMANYSKVQNSAMKSSATQAMAQYPVAAMNFKTDNGRVPKDVQELLDGGYINKSLAMDPWKNNFQLQYDDATGIFKVISAGPDKKIGTKDDITQDFNL